MGSKTKIEWTAGTDGSPGASWNPIRARGADGKIGWHCVHASDGCRFCYAERINSRLGTRLPYQAQTVVETYLDEKMLLAPLHWRKPRKIFVGSMTDLFGDWVTDDMLDRIHAVMALAPQHKFLLLTKRAERMRDYLTARNGMGDARLCRAINAIPAELGNRHGALEMPLPWAWVGVSVEDQRRADERIPLLLATPAAVRWVSYEPALGPVDFCGDALGITAVTTMPLDRAGNPVGWRSFRYEKAGEPRLDWVVCGYESGPGARPGHPDWARSIRDQCGAASVPFFFKQWGEFAPVGYPDGLADRQEEHLWIRVGKRAAGRLLDGREWNEYPEPR